MLNLIVELNFNVIDELFDLLVPNFNNPAVLAKAPPVPFPSYTFPVEVIDTTLSLALGKIELKIFSQLIVAVPFPVNVEKSYVNVIAIGSSPPSFTTTIFTSTS